MTVERIRKIANLKERTQMAGNFRVQGVRAISNLLALYYKGFGDIKDKENIHLRPSKLKVSWTPWTQNYSLLLNFVKRLQNTYILESVFRRSNTGYKVTVKNRRNEFLKN